MYSFDWEIGLNLFFDDQTRDGGDQYRIILRLGLGLWFFVVKHGESAYKTVAQWNHIFIY